MWRERLIDNVFLDTTLMDEEGVAYAERVLKYLEIIPKISLRVLDKEVPGKLIITSVENPLVYNYSRQGAVVLGVFSDSALTTDQLERPISEWVSLFGSKAMWQAAIYRCAKQLESKNLKDPTGESVGLLLQEIAAASPIILTIYDLRAQKNIYQSKSIFHELGYTAEDIEEALSHSDDFFNSVFHQDYINAIGHYYEDIGTLDHGQKKELIYQMMSKGGEWQWFRKISSVFRRDDSGVPTQVLNSFENITAQKLSESRIFETEARNKALIEAIPDIVFRMDENGNCIDFSGNPRAEKYYAFHKGNRIAIKEYFELPINEMYPIEVVRVIRALVQETIITRNVNVFNTTMELDDGIHFYEVLINKSGEHEVIAIARDITERKKQEALLEQRLEYIEFVNRIAQILSFSEIDSIEEPINTVLKELCDFSGFARSYIFLEKEPEIFQLAYQYNKDVGRTVPEGLNMLSAIGFETFLQACKQGEPISMTTEEGIQRFWPENMIHVLKNNQTKFLIIVPLTLGERFLGILGVSTSKEGIPINHNMLKEHFRIAGQLLSNTLIRQYTITELIDSRERALEASRAKEDFLTTISHEIRTPLNAIVGMNELLGTSELNEQQLEMVSAIRLSSKNLLSIVNDILDFSLIESGKMHIEIDKLNLQQLQAEILGVFDLKVREKGIALDLSIEEENDVKVYSDHTRVEQIVNNLVSNAIKFTNMGAVRVTLSALSQNENACLHIKVEDTGIGIPVSAWENIFDRFYQIDSSSKRRFQGTGLGLAIVRRLVEMLGGSLHFTSEEGKGTTFKVQIPSRIGDNQEPRINGMGKRDNGPRGNILIVEDNMLNRMVAERYLRNAGLQVFSAENGQKALELFEREDIDIIFMDLQMPIMDGIETTQRIKELKSDKRNVPIVALTANASPKVRNQVLEMGMKGYITKPFNPDELIAIVHKLLQASPHKKPQT
jgi:signal transduction histidine kinase/PAS domain-containing protein/ActR/RegA family two-component response regulator